MRFPALLLVGTITVACGGNPTQPSTVTAPATVSTQTGEPAPPPAPPAPAPTPTPGPSPTPPAPGPERWQGTGAISNAHWYGSPVLTESFDVQVNRESITFGTMTAAVLAWEQKDATLGVFARPNGMNLQIVLDSTSGKGTWMLSGEAGQATGTLTVKK
jgi:hypothetical protein